ncbi:MAG TPA: 2,3,4,5-tetrahydropyridine-2,6-dicarboxylate N-succinyltransferase [bacterium]
MNLRERIESAFESKLPDEEALLSFRELMTQLNEGRIRAAEKKENGWVVNDWVKKGILLGFRLGTIQDMSIDSRFAFFDKTTFPLKSFTPDASIRLVPGGSSVRDGCYIGKNVILMPPMYVNVGAYVDDGTMVDSHVLVGSCAQIGKRVHLSAGTQIGGVLEPVGSVPVVIEDDVLIGGLCGIFEGVVVCEKAVIGAGTIITGSTPVQDLVRGEVYSKTGGHPLVIPPGAVVIPGTRPVLKGIGKELGLSVYAPIIVKYRDQKTDQAVRFEEWLR